VVMWQVYLVSFIFFYHIYKSSDCIKSYPKTNKIETMQYFSVHVLLYQYLRMDGSKKKLIIWYNLWPSLACYFFTFVYSQMKPRHNHLLLPNALQWRMFQVCDLQTIISAHTHNTMQYNVYHLEWSVFCHIRIDLN
jgi:hypothetical protein